MSEFGGNDGNFLLDEVECTGLESSIEECNHSPWRTHDCHNYEAAGAVCKVGKGIRGDFNCKSLFGWHVCNIIIFVTFVTVHLNHTYFTFNFQFVTRKKISNVRITCASLHCLCVIMTMTAMIIPMKR